VPYLKTRILPSSSLVYRRNTLREQLSEVSAEREITPKHCCKYLGTSLAHLVFPCRVKEEPSQWVQGQVVWSHVVHCIICSLYSIIKYPRRITHALPLKTVKGLEQPPFCGPAAYPPDHHPKAPLIQALDPLYPGSRCFVNTLAPHL
jgi:hypothetical protein